MPKVIIYSKTTCPACIKAKDIMEEKGVQYKEIILDNKPDELKDLIDKTNMRTVPQIFINDEFIGGCSDLMQLDRDKKLDPMLQ